MASASEIIDRSNALRSAYALWRNRTVVGVRAADSAEYFLLLMIVNRLHGYHGINVSTEYMDFITAPAGPYLSRLQLFVSLAAGRQIVSKDGKSLSDLNFWYYSEGVLVHQIGAFLTSRETMEISRMMTDPDEGGVTLSVLELVVHSSNLWASANFDLSQPFARRQFKRWFAREGASALPPWLRLPRSSFPNSVKFGNQFAGGITRPLGEHGARDEEFQSAGVNLFGFADGVLGLGEDLRAFAKVLSATDVPHGICNICLHADHATVQSSGLESLFVKGPVFPINLFCMPLFETERIRLERGHEMFHGRYNIANWAWELSTLPKYWCHAFDGIDEIWAMSDFLVEVYSSLTCKPVVYMPPLVQVETPEKFDLTELGIREENFVFLAMLDFNSSIARKNPLGAILAFRTAFPNPNGIERLIVKAINGHARPEGLRELLRAVGGDPRIIVIDGGYSRRVVLGLIAVVDCFVSLHRSEGFGRAIAEAMLLETPVIATAYSGSNSFLNHSTGYPISYQLVPVTHNDYPYMEGSVWAEPSGDDAVEQFRIVAGKPGAALDRARAGRSLIAKKFGLENVAARVSERLGQLPAAFGIPERRFANPVPLGGKG